MHTIVSTVNTIWNRMRGVAIGAGALVVLISLVRWGGVARPGPLFVAGVALLSAIILAFGLLIWWLYLSPMPRARPTPLPRSAEARQIVAVLVVLSGMLYVIGLFWDEVWHRQYGGFGNDFLWPPHMLLYSSLGLIALFAVGGLLLVLRASGDIRQRFRSDPVIGLLGLMAGFQVASLPSDQLWHQIYGLDLTAWSLPHLLLIGCSTLVFLAAIALQLSLVPPGPWRGLRGLRLPEALTLALIVWAAVILVQLGTTEWEGITEIGRGDSAFSRAFWARPEWLYPVVVVSIALFVGNLALHTLRRAGAATLVGLAVLGFRLGGIMVAPDVGLGVVAQVLLLPPLLALDVWYAARREHTAELRTLLGGNLLAGAVFLLAGLPIIASMMVYPRVNSATLPGMIGMSLLMAHIAGWAGARLGGWLGELERSAAAQHQSARVNWIAAGALAAAVTVLLVFVLTARPPTAF